MPNMRNKLIEQMRSLSNQCQDSSSLTAIVDINDTEYEFDLEENGNRLYLLQQAREALHILEAPQNDFAEFELLDEGFCFDL